MKKFPYNGGNLWEEDYISLLSNLAGTITPWILGTLLLLVILSLAIVVKSWQEMKHSPYFFMRRQAEKRLQTYSFVSLGLIITTAITAGLTLQVPQDDTPLVATLTNAKPAAEEVLALLEESAPELVEVAAETAVTTQVISTADANPFDFTDIDELVHTILILPDEYNQFDPTAQLNEDTDLGELLFSTKISRNYEAINPQSIFAVGNYTLFATFDYEGMADGMTWAWVWKHDGEVVDGGNELWQYGAQGPGYIFYNPEEGFRAGEYTLEVWVNGEMFTRSSVTMTGSALSSGN